MAKRIEQRRDSLGSVKDKQLPMNGLAVWEEDSHAWSFQGINGAKTPKRIENKTNAKRVPVRNFSVVEAVLWTVDGSSR